MSQRSIKTAMPIEKTVSMPLTLEPHVHAMNVPVAISHVHHSMENSLADNQQVFMREMFYSRVTQLPETNITVDSKCHKENQRGIEKN